MSQIINYKNSINSYFNYISNINAISVLLSYQNYYNNDNYLIRNNDYINRTVINKGINPFNGQKKSINKF